MLYFGANITWCQKCVIIYKKTKGTLLNKTEMSELCAAVPNFDWDTASLQSWNKFEAHVKLMFEGPLSGKPEKQQCAYLLLWTGDRGREVFSTWTLDATTEKDKIAAYLTRFRQHIVPSENPVFARYKFFNRSQQAGESMDDFIAAVRALTLGCDFTATALTSDNMIRDRIVCGVSDPKLRRQLLDKGGGLTMADAIKTARAFETIGAQMDEMGAPEKQIKKEIDSLGTRGSRGGYGYQTRGRGRSRYPPTGARHCYSCGGHYDGQHADKCPARGKACHTCGKINHFAKMCRTRDVHAVDTNEGGDEEGRLVMIESLSVGAVDAKGNYPSAFVELQMGAATHSCKFKLDTGAEANVVPLQMLKSFVPRPFELRSTKQTLQAYGGSQIRCVGTTTLGCRVGKNTLKAKFFVVDREVACILGYQTCLDLGLVAIPKQINQVSSHDIPACISQYKNVFQGIGRMEGKVDIRVRPEVQPVVQRPRRVPFAVGKRLKEELARLEKLEIIEKVMKPTEWVNSMVVAEKADGSIRLCLDPRELNEAIVRPHYPVPTFEDITARLHGHQVFTKLDARSGYWMLELTESASDLTTFNTPEGRYRYKRLPFGLSCSQDEFQRRMEETFGDLDGVGVIADDLVVSGRDEKEHDKNLAAVVKRALERNVRFNLDKSAFKTDCIPFFGHLITAEGIKPDPTKVKALQNMPEPKNQEELATFLGMVNYLSRYIPDLATTNQPLRQLSQQEDFSWTETHTKTMQQIKSSICRNLHHYDPDAKEIELTTDASKHGLGAHMSIKGRVVSFASKALTKTEQNYAQIEKELLAVVYGCKRFHQYLYGKDIVVFTDHKPLEAIFKKPIAQAPARLQRMLLALRPYRVTVIFKPGRDIPVADALSRLHHEDELEAMAELRKEINLHVHSIVKSIPISDRKMEAIQEASRKDRETQQLRQTILEGWPAKRKWCDAAVIEYWSVRDELAVVEDIVVKGDRVLIPAALRAEILRQLHTAHLGMEKTKQRARQVVFWPGMGKEIEELTKGCETCARFMRANPKQPLIPFDPPELPWEAVGCDLFTVNGRDYMVTSDYYSRWIEIDYLRSTTAAEVISKLKGHFAREGIPQTIRSDNGPQFKAAEFQQFAREWDFQHATSSPNWPQANGQVEKAVDIAKNLIKKAADSKSDPYLSILEYLNTPIDGFRSPAQMLKSRSLRSTMPCLENHLRPRTVPVGTARRVRIESKKKQAAAYNRGASELPPLKEGQPIWVKLEEDRLWEKATILSIHGDRSYWLKTESGGTYRRNRAHLKPRHQPTPSGRIKEGAESCEEEENAQAHQGAHESQEAQRQAAEENNDSRVGPEVQEPTDGVDKSLQTRSGRIVKPKAACDCPDCK